jgi:RNA polymerase sigma-70 factor, ECF subfamily
MASADLQRRAAVSQLLSTIRPEDHPGPQQLIALVYDELRRIARRYMQHERPDHTLQPTAVVHEAYLRLVDESAVGWQGRTHFRAACARAMRRVLIDYARARKRAKRGGGERPLFLDTVLAQLELGDVDAIELHDALERLAALDPRQGEIVELRFFGGLSVEEVAQHMGVSKRTVESEWTHAKAWLRAELDAGKET